MEQYGIRLRTSDMSWDEFCTYLSGLSEKTALGKVVAIRAEKDPQIIKSMNTTQKQIRREWQKREAKQYTDEELKMMMMQMAKGFRQAYMR